MSVEASRGLDVHIAALMIHWRADNFALQLASKGSNSESEILVQALRDGANP